jgi:hypothetical protein
METLQPVASDQMQVMIPHWVYNRIAALLVAAQSATQPEDYIIAVLEGHVRRLNL